MTTITQSLTAAGVGTQVSLQRGQSLTYAAAGTFTGFAAFERSRTGGASWERVATGAVDTAMSGTVKNESSGDERYRFHVLDTDDNTPVTGTVETSLVDVVDTLQELKAPDGTVVFKVTDAGVETPKITATDITSATSTRTNSAGTVLETLAQTNGASKTTLLNTVNTTNATVTTLHTITLPTDTTYCIRGVVRARRTGGASGNAGDAAGYTFFATVKNISGTASLVSTADIVAKEDQAGFDLTIDATGATIRVRVTGATGNDVTWDLFLEQFGR